MSRNTLYNTIVELAEPLAASLEVDIWGIEVMTGSRGVLKVFLTGKNDDVGINECAHFSRLFGLALEVEDVFDCPYVLEVSSPGLERTFFTPEQLARYVGKNVDIALNEPTEGSLGRKRFWGELTEAADEEFTVMVMDAPSSADERPVIKFCWADLKKASLKHFLPEEEDPRPGKAKKQAASKKDKAGAKEKDGGKDKKKTAPKSERKSEKPGPDKNGPKKPGEEADEFGDIF